MDSHKISDRIERMAWLDRIADVSQRTSETVYRRALGRKVEDLMHGSFLGHPLHPLLTHLPVGMFALVALLDFFPDQAIARSGAELALLFGLIFAIPTIATGAADYFPCGKPAIRRLGALHALCMGTAVCLYLLSLVARSTLAHSFAASLSYLGFVALGVGGYVGGLLVYEKRVGVNRANERNQEKAPAEFVPVMRDSDLPKETPTAVRVGDENVVLVRYGETVHALSDFCSHAGGKLSEGELNKNCFLVCPLHGTAFRLSDGKCMLGPGVFSQPVYAVRVNDGMIEVEVRRRPAQAEVPVAGGAFSLK